MKKQLLLTATGSTDKKEGVLFVHDGKNLNKIVLAHKQGQSLRDAMIKCYPLTMQELAALIAKAMSPRDTSLEVTVTHRHTQGSNDKETT